MLKNSLFQENDEEFILYYQEKDGPILVLCIVLIFFGYLLYSREMHEFMDIKESFYMFLGFCGTVIAIMRWFRAPRIKTRIEPSGISAFDFWNSQYRDFTWQQVRSIEVMDSSYGKIVLRIKDYPTNSFADAWVGTREPVLLIGDRDPVAIVTRLRAMLEKYGR